MTCLQLYSMLLISIISCFLLNAVESNDFGIGSIIGNNNNNNNNNVNAGACRLVSTTNEWAAGCIPAVNFVVKLVDCGEGTAMNDITVRFIDENNKELGRDYFVAPNNGQCTVSGYGNIKTITPRGGNNVYLVASADLCGKMAGINIQSSQMAINGQVADCF